MASGTMIAGEQASDLDSSESSTMRANLYLSFENGESWETHKCTMSALLGYVHVKFSDIRHCSEEECERMEDPKESLVLTAHEDMKASYGSKLAFDIDGHSYTERFQHLLHSHNTVSKLTIFREWHDDFLVPWVHYVPLTLGMKELPE